MAWKNKNHKILEKYQEKQKQTKEIMAKNRRKQYKLELSQSYWMISVSNEDCDKIFDKLDKK